MLRVFGVFAVATLVVAAPVRAEVLEKVRERGSVACGVSAGLAGFASRGPNDSWQGFDAAICQAIAAAIFADPGAVTYVEVTNANRFEGLTSGDVDVITSATSWTYAADATRGLEFAGIHYYDGQGFMVPRELGRTSAKDLDGMTVCVQAGTSSEINLDDYARQNKIAVDKVIVASQAEAQEQYVAGACEVYTTGASGLAATRATFENPSDHVILPEIISKEPLGPVVASGDPQWADIVRWTLQALIAAEELGVTSANIDDLAAAPTETPQINRLLGSEGDFGQGLGLDPRWAYNAIKATGNYGEVFERFIGENTPVGLARGLNALWIHGGLQYARPFI